MNQVERRKKQMAYIADQECGEEMNACKRILHELNTVDRTDGDANLRNCKAIIWKIRWSVCKSAVLLRLRKKYRGR